ncbi:carbonate dehydratase [Marinomonas primoryensis]|uniref:Carbonic anhydrase 2 n=1 Tax=Marinomonas primoryensis TaxID=178399 RepID=A0A859CYT9_9GAMM|nr:carbonate dehydratase [Marinomonas primoryensis]QKK81856.1 uncharacterized protein MP3633_3129 [Marinomonas primoryensis]
MSPCINDIFNNNFLWSENKIKEDPTFFTSLSKQQSPEYLWIGCSDSRVPANEIMSLAPGEVFVHRNVANILYHTDMNLLSVLQYGVDVLKVKHIMVVGHYGCGGIEAAINQTENGIVDYWLQSVRDLYMRYENTIQHFNNKEKIDYICELNVKMQVHNLCKTKIIRTAWERNQNLSVHGWIYGLNDGKIKDLNFTVSNINQINNLQTI